MAPPDHKNSKYAPLRDDRAGSRKGEVSLRDRDEWPAERADRSRVPPHLERGSKAPQRDHGGHRDPDRRDRPRPGPPAPVRRDRDASMIGERPADPQQRRPSSSGRSQDAKPAPEVRTPGLSAMGAGNNIMEELRKAAMARAKQASAKPQADDDMEEGEAEPGEMPGLKRPNPITWQTPPKKQRVADASDDSPADSVEVKQGREPESVSASRANSSRVPQPSPVKAAVPLSAADRAARELEEFTMRNHADVDPNAPPAMKASPSVSGDDADTPVVDAAGDKAKPEAVDEDMVDPPVKVPRSRWLDEEAEEEEPEPVNKAELDEEAARAEQADRELNEREREALAGGVSPEGQPDDEAQGPGAMRSISMLQKCRGVECFEKIRRISEGTYGVVYQARDKETGHMCALKKIKMEKEKDGFPQTSIREINILLSFHHPNIVGVSEVVVGKSSFKHIMHDIYMVMEYVEHDLKQLSEHMKQPFSISEVKCLMQQLLSGMHYLHENWVLHRDLKTSNILYSNKGELKICDFGLARQYGSPLRPYTHNVVTLWYRAPELLLGCKEYSTAIDMWSLGCIMAEFLTKQVLFNEQGEIAQLHKIFGLLGSPSEENWPGVKNLKVMKQLTFKPQPHNRLREKFPAPSFHDDSGRKLTDEGFKLLNGLLTLCPEKRLTAAEALQSKWFTEHPVPKEQALMPTWPDKEAARHVSRPARKQPSPDPRLQPSASTVANRAAEIGTLFSKPGATVS